VGHGLQFHIDRSPATGGIWLDKGEWESLKQRGLHVNLNLIFTASYQRDLRSAEYAQSLEKVFQERIGQQDFERVAKFKEWMAHHPKRRDILCYLSDTKE
jgi:Zn-finger nucleic acid-binding protein